MKQTYLKEVNSRILKLFSLERLTGTDIAFICLTLEDNGFKCLGCGQTRMCFLTPSGKNVVKIPLDCYGMSGNNKEELRYKTKFKDYPVARCRYIKGTFILIMEYLTPPPIGFNYPDWADYVDCQQVGFTNKGKLVAYDFG